MHLYSFYFYHECAKDLLSLIVDDVVKKEKDSNAVKFSIYRAVEALGILFYAVSSAYDISSSVLL